MSSKRWFNILLLIALIHLGAIGVFLRVGVLQPAQWVQANVVSSSAELNHDMGNDTMASLAGVPKTSSRWQNESNTEATQQVVNNRDGLKPETVPPTELKNAHPSASITTAMQTHRERSTAMGDTAANGGEGDEGGHEVFGKTSDTRGGAAEGRDSATLTLPSHIGGYLHNPKPPYPEFSRDAGEQGVVTVSVMVEADGHPSAVDVVKSSGYGRLDRSARETVLHQYRFTPATRGGQAIPYRYRFSIPFVLKD